MKNKKDRNKAKRDFDEKENTRKYKLLSLIIIITSALFFSIIFASISLVVFYKDSIHQGIYVDNIDIGGLSVIEAADKIEVSLSNIDSKEKLKLRHKDKVWTFTSGDLGLKYDLRKAVNEAFLIGRRGNYLDRVKTIVDLLRDHHSITLKTSVDMEKLNRILQSIESKINRPSVDASIKRENNKFIISDEVIGIRLNKEKTSQRIIDGLVNSKYNDIIEIDLIVETIEPKYSAEILSNIQELLGSYSTQFNSAVRGRTHNIKLAAQAIDGTILLPEEPFSFNEVVGPRSANNGYRAAPVIFKGELVDGIGGGVCQVSSTIYNTVLRSQLEIIERVNHSIPSTYVPKGLDATVSYGVLDFKFKNNEKSPIYIESFVKGNKLTVNIYGQKKNNRTVKMSSKITNVIKKDTEIIFDEAMYEGEQIVREKGRNGYRVSSYMTTYENGKPIETKLISKDYYRPSKRVIIKGTKKKEKQSAKENNNEDREGKNNKKPTDDLEQ